MRNEKDIVKKFLKKYQPTIDKKYIETIKAEKISKLKEGLESKEKLNISEKSGVYFVVTEKRVDKAFLEKDEIEYEETEKYKKYEKQVLEEKIKQINEEKEDYQILYIGKANAKKGLYIRLKQYLECNYKKRKQHYGGRAIWHIKDYENLSIVWMEIDKCEELEHLLLVKYKDMHKIYPFANWKS